MSDNTPLLGLPYILASQAQKHVTHNEALRALDALTHIAVKDRDLSTPPGSPAEGDRYIPAAGSSGDWAGHDGEIAAWQDGAWMFYVPAEGWLAYVNDDDELVVFDGTAWVSLSSAMGATVLLNNSANGAQTSFHIQEEEISVSGASIDSTIVIPDRAIVFAVSTRTTEAITGASSYDCGIAGETDKYGALLNVVAGNTNSGVTGPTAFYANTPVRLTANGGTFSAGKVRISIHYMLCPAS